MIGLVHEAFIVSPFQPTPAHRPSMVRLIPLFR